MQKTERYGVLALLLLVITLVAVGAWGKRPEQIDELVVQSDPVSQGRQVEINRPAGQTPHGLPRDPALQVRRVGFEQGGRGSNLASDARNARVMRAVQAQQILEAQRVREAQLQQAAREHNRSAEVLIPDSPSPSAARTARSSAAQTNTSRKGSSFPERVHIVRAGEVFSTIVEKECGGKRFTGQVLACNPGLNPDRIYVGMKLMLPAREAAPTQSKLSPLLAKSPATPSASSGSGRLRSLSVYSVKSGDVLSRIITQQCPPGVQLAEVLALNGNMNPDRIFVGQELRLPRSVRSGVAKVGAKKAPTSSAPRGVTHRVVAGDMLGRIADHHNCTVASIIALNPGLNPDRISVGQVLRMPSQQGADALAGTPALAQVTGLGGRRWRGVQ